MTSIGVPEAGLGAVIIAALTWATRAYLGTKRIDVVDGVSARAQADATVVGAIQAAYQGMIDEQSKRLDEQSKRMDMLQSLVSVKDETIAELHAVIRRLRDHLDVYYRALLELGVKDATPPPEVTVAPERRAHDAADVADPIVKAARTRD